MPEKTLKKTVGSPVSEDDEFWDRETELALFIDYLESGHNLLLVAPRRIGKTSLLRRVAKLMPPSWICLNVDLQKSLSVEDAITELSISTHPHQPLWAKTKEV